MFTPTDMLPQQRFPLGWKETMLSPVDICYQKAGAFTDSIKSIHTQSFLQLSQ